MKRLNPLIAALGLAAGTANAQPPGPPLGGRFDLDNVAVLLDLDVYQKGQVERVLTEQREALRAERERAAREAGDSAATGERPSRDALRARRDEDREEMLGKLQSLLTEQQMTKLRILMEPPQGGRGPRDPF